MFFPIKLVRIKLGLHFLVDIKEEEEVEVEEGRERGRRRKSKYITWFMKLFFLPFCLFLSDRQMGAMTV